MICLCLSNFTLYQISCLFFQKCIKFDCSIKYSIMYTFNVQYSCQKSWQKIVKYIYVGKCINSWVVFQILRLKMNLTIDT